MATASETMADALLEGPRGRRLCLEFALSGIDERTREEDLLGLRRHPEQWRSIAVRRVAHALEPEAGASSRFGFLRSAGDDNGDRDPAPEPEPTPRLAAAALEALELPVADESRLLHALIASVDAARYWQEPDGFDVLASLPELREALHRIAQHLAAAPAARWWGSGVAAEQYAISWLESPDHPRPAAAVIVQGADETLRRWSERTSAIEERARRERPADPAARWSGEWWSMPPEALLHSTRALGTAGPVGLHLVEDDLGREGADARRVEVPADARIIEIEGPQDWAGLCRAHPFDVTAEKNHDWYRTTGRAGTWVMPDWERVAAKADGVHLTMLGYLRAAGRAIAVDAERASVLAGWSPDQVYWLSDRVRPSDTLARWERIEPNTHPNPVAWRASAV